LLEQANYSYFFLKENHNAHPKTKSNLNQFETTSMCTDWKMQIPSALNQYFFSYSGSFHMIRIQVTRRFHKFTKSKLISICLD
jgi:hypothetical protein